ncbi:UDP-2-acetamido-3-amino-2,3-dideoxy-D-glucuronate N-acetyltransferase [Thiorhodovibrio winogradskyi]|uniref:UDP-2-acetamido-3-amino-2, 3-dideoxy-D-glucuronate N-acetyltransferase n=1 Tax=Thiorhodovibrio winogradskyi TaxID=77007 RepID=A0ABZ0SB79_9GAMM
MRASVSTPYNAHPTAIIDAGAQIGEGTRIWHWVHICAGARIGKRCSFGLNVFVGNDVSIGNNCKVQNNACNLRCRDARR